MGKKKQKQIFLKIWASSHGTKYHHFQGHFNACVQKEAKFLPPKYDARGGRKITKNLVKEIKAEITSRGNQPQVHCTILATNNLRRQSRKELEKVFKLFTELSLHVEACPNARLVISDLIPSNEEVEKFKVAREMYRELERRLEKFTSQLRNVSFAKLSNGFIRNRIPNPELYDMNDIHLNDEGARIFAQRLTCHVTRVRRMKCT